VKKQDGLLTELLQSLHYSHFLRFLGRFFLKKAEMHDLEKEQNTTGRAGIMCL